MLTKKVTNRIVFLSLIILTLLISSIFIFKVLQKNLLYFLTPTEILNIQDTRINEVYRIGGMVKKNSITANKDEIKFIVTDFNNEILVTYKWSIPNLFAEGKGVVVEGKLKDKKFIVAKKILAKHDENYMPPELETIMKDAK